MKILFLPNFEVQERPDDSSVPPPNRRDHDKGYWFLSNFPDSSVDVIDNWSPFPFGLIKRVLKMEVFQAFRALVKRKDYDLIFSHSFLSAFVFSLIRSLSSERSPPHFVIDVGSLNGGRENRIEIALVRKALESVSGLIFHSSVNESHYAKHFPEVARAFVPFGTDPDLFKPSGDDAPGEYALSIGYGHRDYPTLIRAWARIDFPLRIVGTVSVDTKGLRNVTLVPHVPLPELLDHIRGARFVVLPIENARYSMGQMTLIQCMSMAKPVLVSRSHGVTDYCRDGENCLTYECGNDGELVEKATMLLSDPELARIISARARMDVLREMNEKEMARRILEFIERTRTRGSPT